MVNIIGLVRFSIISRNPRSFWEIAKETSDTSLEERLFREDRLTKRFALFEALTLPSFDAQVDEDFNLIIMASNKLPRKWKERLSTLCEGRRYLNIEFFNEDKSIQESARASVLKYGTLGKRNVTFRIDDDDAVCKDFIKDLRLNATKELQTVEQQSRIVTFSSGLYIRKGDIELIAGFVNYPLIGIGLAMISNPDAEDTIFSVGNHYNIAKQNVTDLGKEDINWIRTVYEESDSYIARDVFKNHVKKNNIISEDRLKTILEESFPNLRHEDIYKALSFS